MRAFRLLLLVLVLAALGALLQGVLAEDPGYVLLEWAGYSVEATAVGALLALLLLGLALWLLITLLLWPLRALRQQRERSARRRLADGLRAAQRGEHASALKLLARASRRPRLREPALFAAVQAARALGDDERAAQLLDQLAECAPEAARQARVEDLLSRGESAAALQLARAATAPIAPALRALRIEAALVSGAASAAREDMRALLPNLPESARTALRVRVEAAALAASLDLDSLRQRFDELPRPQRLEPGIAAAFATRARALGAAALADDAIEAALARGWDEALAADYGRGAEDGLRERIRRAEAWVAEHPDSRSAELALGRLCRLEGLWGKAEAHLLRATHGAHAALAWEELGLTLVAQGEDARARQSLHNALAVARGEPARELARRPRALPAAPSESRELRTTMGVPLLGDGSAHEAP
jgi:HemY protein